MSRLSLTLCITGLLAVMALGFGAGTAGAAPLSTIGLVGKCCGEALGEYYYANALDINKTTGDLYLLDPNNSRVLVFDQNGNYKFSFGSEGTGGGQLGKYSSVGISVDQTTGDVYVSESGGPFSNNRISKFSEDGKFILTFGRKVNETTLGDVCTKASGDVCQPGSEEGDKAIIFTIAAADPDTGNVFVPHGGDGTTQIYTAGGKYIESIQTPGVVNQISIFKGIIYQAVSSGFKTYTTSGTPLEEIVVPAFSEFSPAGMVPAAGSEKPEETHLYVMMTSNATGKWEVGEFNSSGKLLIEHAIGMPYPTQGALAVDPSIPHIYVGTFPNDPFGGPAIILGVPTSVPAVTLKPVTSLASNSATLNGTVNPEGTTLDTFWHFEYRKTGTVPWTAAPSAEVDIGKGTSPVDVSQGISGLDPNSSYDYRLVGSREFGGGTTTSPIAKLKTGFEKPAISLIAGTHTTDTEATLQAYLDPRNSQTTYYFKYGKNASYGNVVPLDEAGDGGAQLGPSGVFERISGLEPSTTYHFQIVATNPGGTTESGDFEFTTYSTADQEWAPRDIELVTNADNGNQAVLPVARDNMSSDGEEILWGTPSGAPGGYTGYAPLFVSTRDLTSTTGWTAKTIGIPPYEQVGEGDNSYLPAVNGISRSFSAVVFFTTQCFELGIGDCDHTFVRVTRDGQQDVLVDTFNDKANAIAISDDGTYVDYHNPITNELVSFHNGVNTVLPTPSCGYEVPSVREGVSTVSSGTLNRTFVQSNGTGEPCETPGIYMIDRAANSVSLIAPGGQFVRTNEDGSRVIFTKSSPYDVWEWDESSGVECLTCGEMPTVAEGRGFENITVSEDLSHVYFWVRLTGAEEVSCEAGAIYVVHHGEVDFVAKAGSGTCYGDAQLETSPDGNFLVFPSSRSGTTADDITPKGEPASFFASQDGEAYRYDDTTGYVECVSCPGKKGPVGGSIQGGFGRSFALSADGSTVAYATTAPLVKEDINESTDVYEWHNGVIRLITDGEVEFGESSLRAPILWGASDDGRIVGFQAGAELTGNEANHLTNGYAAVVGGPGFPPPNPPAHCVEDSCQGPLQPSPPLNFQGSSAFHGPGNPTPNRGHHKGHHRKKHGHKKKKHRKHTATHGQG